jgi:hypothetical protein
MANTDIIPTEAITRNYTWERIYPLPNGEAYKAVNAAVAYAISVMSRGLDPVRDETAGYTKYTITSLDNITFQLHVLYISEQFANVRLNPLIPAGRVEFAAFYLDLTRAKHTLDQIVGLFDLLHGQIAIQLRRAVKLDDCDPPPPPKSDLDALLTWQEIYHPAMRVSELARIAGVESQSIYNARHRLNHTKQAKNGKSKRK